MAGGIREVRSLEDSNMEGAVEEVKSHGIWCPAGKERQRETERQRRGKRKPKGKGKGIRVLGLGLGLGLGYSRGDLTEVHRKLGVGGGETDICQVPRQEAGGQ